MKKIFALCCLCCVFTSCSNKPSNDLAEASLKKNFENNIEIVDFEYINGLKSEEKKIDYYTMYFDANIKFINDWIDNSPGFRGKRYKKGDIYKIDYGNINFISTDNGWVVTSINFKWENGFIKIDNSKVVINKSKNDTSNDVVKLLNVDIPLNIKFTGNFIDAIKWKDNNGTNYLVISDQKQGKYGESGYSDVLFGCCFANNGTNTKKLWEIKEASDIVSQMEYIRGSLKAVDINNDGIFESIFLYQKSGDGASTIPLKLMLHSGTNKYAIRGEYCPERDVCGEYQKMAVGDEFSNAPSSFQPFAVDEYTRSVSKLIK